MKKNFLAGLLTCLAATQVLTGYTQGPNMQISNPAKLVTMAAAEKAVPAYVDQTGGMVRAKVINTFLQLFDNPTDVKWNLTNHRYLASFNNNDHACTALFNEGGSWVYSMKNGTQKDLPRDVYRLLKATYIDFDIKVAKEVTTPEWQAWIVNLEDKDNLIVAQVVDGELKEMHRYKTHF